MRAVVMMMGIVSLLGMGAGAQSTDATKAQRSTVTLKVYGMSCGACAARVEKTAKEISGVTGAKASQPKGTAEITFEPTKITAEDIAALITKKSGFTAEVPKQ
jgi:P-type Cu+ transporter